MQVGGLETMASPPSPAFEPDAGVCPGCGREVLGRGDLYCGYCGTRIPSASRLEATDAPPPPRWGIELGGPLSVDPEAEPSLLAELSAVGLTMDELEHIALLGADSNSPALIGAWFDSERQVALTVAGGCLGAAIAAFIGDVTIVGTMNGILSSGAEIGALASLTALTVGCGAAASYYLTKVRRIASRSLRVQHILAGNEEQS